MTTDNRNLTANGQRGAAINNHALSIRIASIRHLYDQVVVLAPRATRAREAAAEAKTALEDLIRNNPDLARVSSLTVAGNLTFFLLPVATYCVDLFLFNVMVQCFVKGLTTDPNVVVAAALLVPFFIVLVDLAIAAQIHNASENALLTEDQTPRVFWSILGLGFAFTTAGSVIALDLLTRPERLTGAEVAGLDMLLVCRFALVLILHLLLVFGGRPMQEAKEYIAFALGKWLGKRRVNKTQKQKDTAWQRFCACTTAFFTDKLRLANQFPGARAIFPSFPADVQTLVDEAYPPLTGPTAGSTLPTGQPPQGAGQPPLTTSPAPRPGTFRGHHSSSPTGPLAANPIVEPVNRIGSGRPIVRTVALIGGSTEPPPNGAEPAN